MSAGPDFPLEPLFGSLWPDQLVVVEVGIAAWLWRDMAADKGFLPREKAVVRKRARFERAEVEDTCDMEAVITVVLGIGGGRGMAGVAHRGRERGRGG